MNNTLRLIDVTDQIASAYTWRQVYIDVLDIDFGHNDALVGEDRKRAVNTKNSFERKISVLEDEKRFLQVSKKLATLNTIVGEAKHHRDSKFAINTICELMRTYSRSVNFKATNWYNGN